MWFDDLVIIAKVSHPIPFRTRPLNPFALMVLRLKARESKSSPDLLTILECLIAFCLPCLCLLILMRHAPPAWRFFIALKQKYDSLIARNVLPHEE